MDDTNKLKIREGMVLTVPNHHIEMSGKPPDLMAKGCYTAYFENQYGEQLVFQYDYKAKEGTLWHGDYSWEEPVQIMGGGTTMILGEEEREWLHLVWRTATKGESREFQLQSALGLINTQKAVYDELIASPEVAGDTFMQRSFSKIKRKLEKERKAILEELEKIRGMEEAVRIIHKEGGEL